jgi:hypothetical protein
MVHSRRVGDETLTFGVSGRLYKSNVLLYDHQSESLWSQLLESSVAGRYAGTRLVAMPAVRTTWKSWQRRHPETLVLSTETGYRRDYATDPYAGYARAGGLWFPVGKVRGDLSPKARVLGIASGDDAMAFPMDRLRGSAGRQLSIRIGSVDAVITVGPGGDVVAVSHDDGRPLPHVFSYWFAWQAFHPGTGVYRPGAQ